ncbi:MAG: PHB depolymerase family esterase [Myxococcota bacterium]
MWLAMILGCGVDEPGAGLAELQRAGWNHGTVTGVTVDLFVPSAAVPAEGRPLMIVLHGCTQTPADLKSRVDWQSVSEAFGAVISLPKVPNGGVYAGCWNYYGANHSRTTGDAGRILDLVDAITGDPNLGVDPDRVWIAGLSSGAGMAMVMGCLAPDVFSGVGIAAGPTVGTSAFQISSVGTTLSAAKATCSNLAGANRQAFDTQLTSVIAGTRDYTVAQGYADLNADVMAAIYGEGGAALTESPFDVSALHGYDPQGTGVEHVDDVGPRVQRISAADMGHAWPAGTGAGAEIQFVASEGVDYAWTLATFFTANGRRGEVIDLPDDPPADDPPADDPPADDPPADDPPADDPPADGCWTDEALDDINGHLSRYDVYTGGYGVADVTYVDLLDQHGLREEFPLYLAPSGDWYADPASITGQDCP